MKPCVFCNKNKVAGGSTYCSKCYRDRKEKQNCGRCDRLRPCISSLCLPCYNYHHSGHRVKALMKYGEKCISKSCPFKPSDVPVRMLDVDHIIEGNRKNNNLDNLQILCVWCHALKTRKIVQ